MERSGQIGVAPVTPSGEIIPISPLDLQVQRCGGTTSNLERLPRALKYSKSLPPPSRDQILREQGRLRVEANFCGAIQRICYRLLDGCKKATYILRKCEYQRQPKRAIFAREILENLLSDSTRRIEMLEHDTLAFLGASATNDTVDGGQI
ncbi:hypothetical protein D8B26_005382 [Coccidioides posadasii str. Silveira]|uniref:Uncharacterized protein n=1 Tax=Coccidioides posadasii (strain RMSCC 757 / Silveira) TaxID=443226 RepID=E9D556_COCPS|nr:conserved hypothetical protein [Coccidioides posadasii str. Silveira]QVM10729.1 hypothetical protein D8B26_005382 [Coccidioides posadasii str. Silveira]